MSDNGNQTRPHLGVDDVTVQYGEFKVLDGVSFEVGAATLMGVVGPNGAGKSTLFGVLAGVVPTERGRVRIQGHSAEQDKGALAYVPQRERVNWRFPLTVDEVVMLGRSSRLGWLRRPGKLDKELVEACLDRVDMLEHRADLMTELSGGHRQRVFVARALAQEADILLFDEAFSGVDIASQEGLVTVLRSLRDDGKIILIATHDLTNLAGRFDQVLCLNHHVCAFGPPEEAFTPEVLEELYGAHGIEFVEHHTHHGRSLRRSATSSPEHAGHMHDE